MNTRILMLAASVLALAPAAVSAAPGGNGGSAQGSTNGVGWGNGPTSTGQPGAECEDLIADGEGAFPGQAADNGHSAFGGSAGDVYAGHQPQNTVNIATSSQYDTACLHQQPAG
jgi:hypothetical protein